MIILPYFINVTNTKCWVQGRRVSYYFIHNYINVKFVFDK